MSKAEELADALMMQAKTLRLAWQNDAAVTDIETSAAELRRLAALEKAIMDAEPVAWRDPTNTYPDQSVTFSKLSALKWPHIYRQPLYTLNGIKKP